MKRNMGATDRFIRVLVAIAFIILYALKVVTGTWGIVLLVVGIIFLLTSFVSFCPLYAVCGIKSNKEKTPA